MKATWTKNNKARRKFERKIQSAIVALMQEQQRSVLTKIGNERKLELPSISALFNLVFWRERLFKTIYNPVFNTVNGGFNHATKIYEFDVVFDAKSKFVLNVVSELLDKTNEINVTTKQQLQRIIVNAVEQKKSIEELKSDIRAKFVEMQNGRAQVIAQTTSTAAFEAGQIECFNVAGIAKKRWLTQRDGAVRSTHKALDGVEIPVKDKFSNGLRFPADPNGKAAEIINCRCTLLPITDE